MKRVLTVLAVSLAVLSFAAAQAVLPKIQYKQSSEEEYEEPDSSSKNDSDNSSDDDEYEEGDEGEEDFFDLGMHLPGDQFIRLSLGLSYPLNFPDASSVIHGDSQLKAGGQGSIGYHSFINSYFALGVDIGFGFNVTIGSHSFNTVPILLTGTYEPCIGKFSFPLSLGVGAAWESYNGKNYFPGLVLRPDVGAHYRITENWTVGLDTSYMFLPQFNSIHSDEENMYGHFWTVDLCARYMF